MKSEDIEPRDTAHELDEFGSFPWHQMNDEWFASCGGVSHGGVTAGVDFNPMRPHISFTHGDLSVDSWEIPMPLMRLLKRYQDRGEENVRDVLRKLVER